MITPQQNTLRKMDWDKLRVFHAVALAGSFTQATKTLNISQSAISRQIHILEKELETLLFKRTARGLIITEAGKMLNETVLNIFSKLTMVETAIVEFRDYARGHIEIASSLAFGSGWLALHLQEFLDQYPDISVSLFLKDEEIDLTMREADIAITTTPINNPDIIQSDPIPYQFRVYAHQSYLKKYGTPQQPEDLSHHRLIAREQDMPEFSHHLDWLLTVGTQNPRTPYLVTNSDQTIYELTRSGIGIALLDKYMINNDSEMIEIMQHISKPIGYRYIVYPKQLSSLKRIQVCAAFLLEQMIKNEL